VSNPVANGKPEITNERFVTGKTVREIARAHRVLPAKKLEKILDPWRMTQPGIPELE